MAKLYATLLLLSISGVLMAMVAGDLCEENVGGACNAECNSRCLVLHEGGKGLCKPPIVGSQESCWCSYDCPPKKTCEIGLLPTGSCDDKICDSDCAAKYPGQGAVGFCYSLGPSIYEYCLCKYFC